MAKVKWIKIVTDIFDDEKILLIESLPEADSIIVIWFKLLTLAGKQNNSGVFMLNEKIPYTDEMFATIFRRKKATVQMALKTFRDFGMIEIINNTVSIPNWSKHQSLEQIENKAEYMRNYMKKYREKQKAIAEKTNSKTNGKTNSKTNSKTNVSSTELDKESEKEKEKEILNNLSDDKLFVPLLQKWNELHDNIPKVNILKKDTQRYKMLSQRYNEYGEEKILQAIENIGKSKFLQGVNDSGWTITFEWFVRPNNFVKVLEGNYNDRNGFKTPEKEIKSYGELI